MVVMVRAILCGVKVAVVVMAIGHQCQNLSQEFFFKKLFKNLPVWSHHCLKVTAGKASG